MLTYAHVCSRMLKHAAPGEIECSESFVRCLETERELRGSKVSMYLSMYPFTRYLCIYQGIYVTIYVSTYVCVCMYVCMYYTYIYIYIYIYADVSWCMLTMLTYADVCWRMQGELGRLCLSWQSSSKGLHPEYRDVCYRGNCRRWWWSCRRWWRRR